MLLRRCPATGKLMHPTARRAYKEAGRMSKRDHERMDAYHCPACGFFHVGGIGRRGWEEA